MTLKEIVKDIVRQKKLKASQGTDLTMSIMESTSKVATRTKPKEIKVPSNNLVSVTLWKLSSYMSKVKEVEKCEKLYLVLKDPFVEKMMKSFDAYVRYGETDPVTKIKLVKVVKNLEFSVGGVSWEELNSCLEFCQSIRDAESLDSNSFHDEEMIDKYMVEFGRDRKEVEDSYKRMMNELKFMREILKDAFQGKEFSSIPDIESKFENLSLFAKKSDLQSLDEKKKIILSWIVPRFEIFASNLKDARKIATSDNSKDSKSDSSKYLSSTEVLHVAEDTSNKVKMKTINSTVDTRLDQCSGYLSMTPLAQSTPRNSSSQESFKRHLEKLDKGENLNMVKKMNEDPLDVGSSDKYLIATLVEYVDEGFSDKVKTKFMNLMTMLDDGTGKISCNLMDNLMENCPHLFVEA